MNRAVRNAAAAALLAAAVVCAAAPRAASAQILSNPGQWYTNNQIYSMRVFNGIVGNSMLGKGTKKGGKAKSPGAGKKAATTDPTVFKESARR